MKRKLQHQFHEFRETVCTDVYYACAFNYRSMSEIISDVALQSAHMDKSDSSP